MESGKHRRPLFEDPVERLMNVVRTIVDASREDLWPHFLEATKEQTDRQHPLMDYLNRIRREYVSGLVSDKKFHDDIEDLKASLSVAQDRKEIATELAHKLWREIDNFAEYDRWRPQLTFTPREEM